MEDELGVFQSLSEHSPLVVAGKTFTALTPTGDGHFLAGTVDGYMYQITKNETGGWGAPALFLGPPPSDVVPQVFAIEQSGDRIAVVYFTTRNFLQYGFIHVYENQAGGYTQIAARDFKYEVARISIDFDPTNNDRLLIGLQGIWDFIQDTMTEVSFPTFCYYAKFSPDGQYVVMSASDWLSIYDTQHFLYWWWLAGEGPDACVDVLQTVENDTAVLKLISAGSYGLIKKWNFIPPQ